MGLIMLVLIGLLPAHFALNNDEPRQCEQTFAAVTKMQSLLGAGQWGEEPADSGLLAASCETEIDTQPCENAGDDGVGLGQLLAQVADDVGGKKSFSEIPPGDRWGVRTGILELNHALVAHGSAMWPRWTHEERLRFEATRLEIRNSIDYVPRWTVAMVALCLGLGGLFGWKRVVVTVGEKIGKSHLTYGQGVSAQFVAMSTIGLADLEGLPVSTTHVLSSGVAGSATASGTGLNPATVRSILLAWLLTLPASILLSSLLLLLGRQIIGP